MDSGREAFPSDIEALKAALVTARDERIAEAAKAAQAEAELAVARAKASDDQALIAHQQLRIEKLTRQLYGPRSERTSRLLDDDRPFGGTAPPAAMFYYSRDRAGEHPQAHLANYARIFQPVAYSGFYKPHY